MVLLSGEEDIGDRESEVEEHEDGSGVLESPLNGPLAVLLVEVEQW